MNPQKRKKKAKRPFFLAAKKMTCPCSWPSSPHISQHQWGELPEWRGNQAEGVLPWSSSHWRSHTTSITTSCTPWLIPSSRPPLLPSPPCLQSSKVREVTSATSTAQFFVSKYSAKEKLKMKSCATKWPLWRKHQSHTMNALYHLLMGKGKIQKRQRDCLNGQVSFPDSVKENTLMKLES